MLCFSFSLFVLNVRVPSPLFIKGKATLLGLTFVPGPDLREGKLGSWPRASTTRGPPQVRSRKEQDGGRASCTV